MERKPINEALFLARVYWRKSQVDMAKSLGISQSHLSEIEGSIRNVDVSLLDRYSKALGIPKSTLMIFSENLEDKPAVRSGRYVVADWALKILERLVPNDVIQSERSQDAEVSKKISD